MFRTLFILSLASFSLSAQEIKKVSLFNGKNLDGWDVLIGKKSFAENEQEIFTVKDGVIHAYPTQKADSKQPFAGLVSKATYENYHLSVEYRWGEKKFAPRHKAVRDAGVLFHIAKPDKIWPASVEIQIQEGDTGDLWIISANASSKIDKVSQGYSPKGKLESRPENVHQKYAKVARSYSWEQAGWNKVEIIVRGDDAVFKVNGHVVNEAIDCRAVSKDGKLTPLTKGHILLQAEGAEIFYRNITLAPLKAEEKK